MNVYVVQTQSRMVIGIFNNAAQAENLRQQLTGDTGTVMKWPVES